MVTAAPQDAARAPPVHARGSSAVARAPLRRGPRQRRAPDARARGACGGAAVLGEGRRAALRRRRARGRRAVRSTSASARPEPVIELAVAVARAHATGALAVVGAGTDDLLLVSSGARELAAGVTVAVGTSPVAVAALPGGRWVTADRLSDTLTFVEGPVAGAPPRVVATLDLVVGEPSRSAPAELGEVLFYSRSLTPHNVAEGPLSIYTCAACHDDGHVDGRRHPSKRNRFASMTKTCRGIGTTAPYLSLGEPDTIDAFADNIVATHAQGAEGGPEDYDRYPVTLRLRAPAGDAWRSLTLSPEEVRAALAAYMARIPTEPSPFVAPGQRALTRPSERRGPRRLPGRLRGLPPARRRHGARRSRARPRARAPTARRAGRAHERPPLRRGHARPRQDGQQPAVAARRLGRGAVLQRRQRADARGRVLRRHRPVGRQTGPRARATPSGLEPAWTGETRAALLAFLRAL